MDYSNYIQEVENFNKSAAGELKLPTSLLGYYCISHYELLSQFSSNEVGMRILEMLFNYGYEAGKFADFIMKMINKASDFDNIHFVGMNEIYQLILKVKNTWYVFDSHSYSKYDKDDIDVYSNFCGMTYIADTYPTLLATFYSCDVLICDDEITDNLLEYDDEIFNPTYDYDDSEEDDEEESDSYEDYEEDNYSDEDSYYEDEEEDEGDDYEHEEYDDDDLSEVDQERIDREAAFASNIRRENELNRRIRDDNPDLTITSDGSYPEYYNQRKRIVIIGREDRGLDGADYNETLMEGYKSKKIGVNNGYKTPNAHTTHRRVLKYAKGLEDDLEYSDIENANDLADELGEKDGYSFAYINASKASNLKDNSQVLNKPQYDDFIERNKKKKIFRKTDGNTRT